MVRKLSNFPYHINSLINIIIGIIKSGFDIYIKNIL